MRNVIAYYQRFNGSGHIVEHIDNHESGDLIIGQLFESTEKGYRAHPYDFHKDFQKIDKSVVDALERQTCPQRGATSMFEKGEELDHWRQDKTCSFCGSLNPTYLLEQLKQGKANIQRTDKSYKWYVNTPLGHGKYYLYHNTPEFVEGYNNWINSFTTPSQIFNA